MGLRALTRSLAQTSIFQIPWQRIVNGVEMIAASHETYAQKIDEDIERPLRDYQSRSRELSSMPGVQGDLELELLGLANALYNLGTTVINDLTKEKEKVGSGKQVGLRV